MTYQLAPWNGETIAVPQLIFNQLQRGEENLTRVALYILSTHTTDATEIARALRLKSVASAQRALDFWYGAGLLEKAPHQMAGPEPEAPIPSPKLTPAEIQSILCTDPQISVLMSEAQKLWGGVINATDTNILINLYQKEEIPVDTLLYALAHAISEGYHKMFYVQKIALKWKESGILTGEDAERYLHLSEQRKKRELEVSELLYATNKKFTPSEKEMICTWFETYQYTLAMIQETLLYIDSKEKYTVRYINSIIKSWYAKGWRTVRDVQASKAITGMNVQPIPEVLF